MWWLVTSASRDRGSHRGSWTFTTVPCRQMLGEMLSRWWQLRDFSIFHYPEDKMIQFDLPIFFQMGWFKHQLESDTACSFKTGPTKSEVCRTPGLGRQRFGQTSLRSVSKTGNGCEGLTCRGAWGGPRKLQHTPISHTPGNPPSQR